MDNAQIQHLATMYSNMPLAQINLMIENLQAQGVDVTNHIRARDMIAQRQQRQGFAGMQGGPAGARGGGVPAHVQRRMGLQDFLPRRRGAAGPSAFQQPQVPMPGPSQFQPSASRAPMQRRGRATGIPIPEPRPGWETAWKQNQWWQIGSGAVERFSARAPYTPQQWDDDLALLDEIGYDVKQEIGRGGYGAVFVAEYTDSAGKKITLACKRMELFPAYSTIPPQTMLGYMEAEKQALMRCNHPNIVGLQNVISFYHTDPNTPHFIVFFMPLAHSDLERLHSYCSLIPMAEVRVFWEQLLSGLSYLHQNGIAHRDIKPQNVLVFKDAAQSTSPHTDCVLKLTDFGLVHLFEPGQRPRTGSLVGTKAWRAPEVEASKSSRAKYDPLKADIWSMGLTLAQMLIPHDDVVDFKNLFQTNTSNLAPTLLDEVKPSRQNQIIEGILRGMLSRSSFQRQDAFVLLQRLSDWS